MHLTCDDMMMNPIILFCFYTGGEGLSFVLFPSKNLSERMLSVTLTQSLTMRTAYAKRRAK